MTHLRALQLEKLRDFGLDDRIAGLRIVGLALLSRPIPLRSLFSGLAPSRPREVRLGSEVGGRRDSAPVFPAFPFA